MTERPILFSGPMVRAIIDGRKTVTRRVIKAPIPSSVKGIKEYRNRLGALVYGFVLGRSEVLGEIMELAGIKCPVGQPGDLLWVREAWAADAQVNAVAPADLSQGEPVLYPADGAVRQTGCSMITPGKTRPSIHMPRWACRILLEITAVRVERLHDISEEHSRAEGYPAERQTETGGSDLDTWLWFRSLWKSINGADSWDANPWVWVVEFRQVMP